MWHTGASRRVRQSGHFGVEQSHHRPVFGARAISSTGRDRHPPPLHTPSLPPPPPHPTHTQRKRGSGFGYADDDGQSSIRPLANSPVFSCCELCRHVFHVQKRMVSSMDEQLYIYWFTQCNEVGETVCSRDLLCLLHRL